MSFGELQTFVSQQQTVTAAMAAAAANANNPNAGIVAYDANNPAHASCGWTKVLWLGIDTTLFGGLVPIDLEALVQKELYQSFLQLKEDEFRDGVPDSIKVWAKHYHAEHMQRANALFATLSLTAPAPANAAVPSTTGTQPTPGSDMDQLRAVFRGDRVDFTYDNAPLHTTMKADEVQKKLPNYMLYARTANAEYRGLYIQNLGVNTGAVRDRIIDAKKDQDVLDNHGSPCPLRVSDEVLDPREVYAFIHTSQFQVVSKFNAVMGTETPTMGNIGVHHCLVIQSLAELKSVGPLKAACQAFCSLIAMAIGLEFRKVVAEVLDNLLALCYTPNNRKFHMYMLHTMSSIMVKFWSCLRGINSDPGSANGRLDLRGPVGYGPVLQKILVQYAVTKESQRSFAERDISKEFEADLLKLCTVASRKITTDAADAHQSKRARSISPVPAPRSTSSTSAELCIANFLFKHHMPNRTQGCNIVHCPRSHREVKTKVDARTTVEALQSGPLKKPDFKKAVLDWIEVCSSLTGP